MGISSISGGMSTYGSKGMGGLMSGLDVDELVKGMTSGTSGKIAKLLQQKQSNTWKSDSYRAISSQLIDFSNKYMNSSSKTNLSFNEFFSKNGVTASGTNSKYLSVTGKSNSAEDIQILAVEQLARDASRSLSGGALGSITTGTIDLDSTIPVDNVKGQTINVSYGGKNYSIALKDKVVTDATTTPPTEQALTYETEADVVTSLNALIENDTKLADLKGKVTFSASGSSLSIGLDSSATGSLKITGGTGKVLDSLGITADMEIAAGATETAGAAMNNFITNMPITEALAEKSISFNYNGVTKSIKLGTQAELDALADGTDFAKHIQDKLGEAFGSGRVKVGFAGAGKVGELSFETTLPGGAADKDSYLKVNSADPGLLGDTGLLKMQYGSSTRVNLNAKIKDSGLNFGGGLTMGTLPDGTEGYAININGKDFTFTDADSVGGIISKINNSNAGVKITYSETSDSFNIKATDGGASGKIEIKDTTGNLAAKLFNSDASGNNDTANGIYGATAGKSGEDAKIVVDFDGVGQGADATTITRGSNNFNLDGLNVTINQVFDSNQKDSSGNDIIGTDGKPIIDNEKLIRFTAVSDTGKVIDAIKQMADDYNKMVDEIQKTTTQKHDKKYPPLTAEQKKEMSEDEIKTWEEKAKQGLLFNDSTLNALASELRFVFSSYTQDSLKSIGISNAGSGTDAYKNNGKISIDEDKLRTALAERPNDVAKMFTEPMIEREVDGVKMNDITTGGVMSRMKEITDKYAKTVGSEKGILVEKAGHPASPVSLISNIMQKANDETDKLITRLEASLKTEEARYYKQFTQLEQLVSKMNSQSSALSELTGGA